MKCVARILPLIGLAGALSAGAGAQDMIVNGGNALGLLTIPVAASIHGANQTFFHTDAWIMNRSHTSSNVVTAVYRCFGGVGCGAPKTLTLAPREVRLITDIVATLFAVPESGGAIELSWDTSNGPITSQTRLFTPTSPPSYGFGVPALPSSAAATRAVFVGVAGSGANLTTGFRSNGGAYNPNAFPVTVRFTLTDGATGAPIGSPFTRAWGPLEAAQVNNLVTALGAGSLVTTDAVLVATASSAVFFYVATIDNASGDSIYVAASPDELVGAFDGPAAAQNLVVNGTFNKDVSSWPLFLLNRGTAVYSGLDANGSNTSGSLQMTNTFQGSANYYLIQCLAATPGVSYDFGAKARIPTGQPGGIYHILVNFFTAPNCFDGGGTFTGSSRIDFTPSGAWQGVTRTGIVAGAGAASVSILLGNFKVDAEGTTVVNYDDVFFAVTNTLRAVATIPVAASIHGANNTFFHSDAWILNRSFTNTNVVTAVYHCFGGVGCGAPKTITLAPREARLIEDIVATLFGVPESGGAIELFWDVFNGPVTAQTRLFTPSSPPSYGFGVPALPASAAMTRAVFVGVAGNPDVTKGFRSNGGAYNPNAFPVTVTLTLTDGATGAPVGSPLTRVWAPFEAAQISNLVASLGGTAATANAVLVATAAGGPVFFYVATIDNASGDSIYVTASADEAP